MADGRFLAELHIRQLSDGQRVELTAPLTYVDEDGTSYTVPFDYPTNLESIPRGLWNIFPKWGKGARAGVVHDFLCDTKPLDSDHVHALYRRALKACGVSKFEQHVKFWSVKIGGPNFKARPVEV